MDGIHDMGGMHGFGPIHVEDDAAFHDDWERLVFGIDRVLKTQGCFGIDEKRHAIERMGPDAYLNASYFERWLAALETLLTEQGVLSPDELDAAGAKTEPIAMAESDAAAEPGAATDDLVAMVREAFGTPASFDRESRDPRFAVDERVVVRNEHPDGHTRCPDYARRSRGTVDRIQGTFVVPDERAHGTEAAEPLYSVAFDAEELWGPDAEGPGTVSIDLWERYLRRPRAGERS